MPRLAPTDLTSFLRLESCERFLWYRLHPRETRRLFQGQGLAEQPLTPLLSVRGAQRERACHEALADSGHRILDLRRGPPADTLERLGTGQAITLVEAPVQGVLGGFACAGRADLVQIHPSGPGRMDLHVIDIKASRRDRLEHRVQVAIYCELLEQMSRSLGLKARLKGSVWRLPGQGPDTPTPFDLLPCRGFLEQMVAPPDGVVWRMARASRQEAWFHLIRRCDGCPYNALCLREAFESRDLSLVPFLEAPEKRLLIRHGITRVEELAALKEHTDRVAVLGAPDALGRKLEAHIRRAGAVLRRMDSRGEAEPDRLFPLAPEPRPEGIQVFLEAWWDYLEDRVYMLGALVVAPGKTREVVRLAPAPPGPEQEATLLEEWTRALLEALGECASTEPTRLHFCLYERQDLRLLQKALTRHPGRLGAFPEILVRAQDRAGFLAEEIRLRYDLGLLCQSLPQVAWETGFDWNFEGKELRGEFRARVFDNRGELPDGTPYEAAARFSSQVPLEYAYGAWQRLPPPEKDRHRVLDGFRQATPEGLQTLARARLHALAHLEATLPGRTPAWTGISLRSSPIRPTTLAGWLGRLLHRDPPDGGPPGHPLVSPWPFLLAGLTLCGGLWWAHQAEMRRLQTTPPPPGTLSRIGRVGHSRTTVGNGQTIALKTDQGQQILLLSPRLGLVDPPLRPGDRVRVVAIPRVWRKRSFLLPLTRAHLQVIERGAPEVPLSTLAEVLARPKGAQVAVLARVERFWTFRSRRGLNHLKFVLDDGTAKMECLMFEGAATPLDRRRLESGRVLRVEGRTDLYDREPSLVVRSVSEGS